jgi:predicted RecA/RadA family phage recombinase
MATNQVYEPGDHIQVTPTAPATVNSGDPVLVGDLPGVALTDEDSDGKVTVTLAGVYKLAVTAESGAITPGTKVYYDAGDSGLNDTSAGNTPFGFALGSVTSGSTSTIPVKIHAF